MTRGPARMPITPRQAQALTAAADGKPLREVADHLGVTRERVASLLSRDQRRDAAVRTARRRGLIPPADDGGPTVREAAADDKAWPLQKAGE